MPEQHDHNDAEFADSTPAGAEHESDSITAPDDLLAPGTPHGRHGAPDGDLSGPTEAEGPSAGGDHTADGLDGPEAELDGAAEPQDPGAPDAEPEETPEQKAAREREEYMLRLFQAAVVGPDAERIGRVGQVYLDDRTQEPNWVTVKTGLFGTKELFIPLDQATLEGKHLVVPYSKATVIAAPRTEIDQNLSPAEEDDLYDYYRVPGRMTVTSPEQAEADHEDDAGLTADADAAPAADERPTVAEQDETSQVAASESASVDEQLETERANAVDEIHADEAEGHDDVDERLFAPPSSPAEGDASGANASGPGAFAGSDEPSTLEAAEESDWSRKGE